MVRIEPPEVTGDALCGCTTPGIGLTEAQVHELLATIGRSSKRDELGFARHEFLGQFGIGLLSASWSPTRSRWSPAPPGRHVRWIGYADGRYDVSLPESSRDEPGTTVTLRPAGTARTGWPPTTVTELARLYGDCCR